MDLLSALPGAVAQGLIWGIMAIGVYITYKILDIADLTVDGYDLYGRRRLHDADAIRAVPVWAVASSPRCLPGVAAGAVDGRSAHSFREFPPFSRASSPSWRSLVGKPENHWERPIRPFPRAITTFRCRRWTFPPRIVHCVDYLRCCLVALLYLFFGTELGCEHPRNGHVTPP